jgi:LytS/YehU family sensor histidine kinase
LSASNVITFNIAGKFYRFMGKLSNGACEDLHGMIKGVGTFQTVTELDGVMFFCYSTPVFAVSGQESERIGTVVLLTHLDRKRTVLAGSTGMDTAIVQDDIILLSNDESLEGKIASELEQIYGLVSLIPIEGTTLYVVAAVKNEAMFPGRTLFFVTSFALLAVLLLVVMVLYRYLSGYIMLPMELRAKNAEIEKQKALVFSLKKQINAHFTNHTLNTIRILMKQDEIKKAEAVATGLSALIRYAHDKDEFINIWDELEMLKNYVVIMNTRYDGKLEVDFDFDDRLMKYSIPRMLLQPIIENAILHGFAEKGSECIITVKAVVEGDFISFHISDNGRGMSESQLAALREKLKLDPDAARGYENIALLNIKNRLYHYFGEAGQLAVAENDGGGITVSVVMLSEII